MSSPPTERQEQDAFAALGIEPTLDIVRVKRAYFEAVARTPPHRDAEAFGRLRQAYDALMRPGGLEAQYLAAPVRLEHEAAAIRERYETRLAQARARVAERVRQEGKLRAFIEVASSSTLAEFAARFPRS